MAILSGPRAGCGPDRTGSGGPASSASTERGAEGPVVGGAEGRLEREERVRNVLVESGPRRAGDQQYVVPDALQREMDIVQAEDQTDGLAGRPAVRARSHSFARVEVDLDRRTPTSPFDRQADPPDRIRVTIFSSASIAAKSFSRVDGRRPRSAARPDSAHRPSTRT